MGTEIGRVEKAEDLASEQGAGGQELLLLRATLENMAQGVAMYDADHRLVTWNALFREYLDIPEEFLGTEHTFSDYIRYLHQRGEFGDADVEAMLEKRIQQLNHAHSFERVRPDGTVLEVRRDPIPGGGFIAIYTDITERKRAEQRLKDEEERLRQIDEAAPVGLVILAWPSRIIRHVNPQFARMFRKESAQFLGKSIEGLLDDPEKGREFGDVMGRLPSGPQEFAFQKEDGSTCYTMVFGGALNFMHDPCIIATVSDITDRVHMEDQLREAKEAAESASQVKSAFLANMSHELRTPLNAIIGYSEILQEDARDDGNDALVADLEKIQGAGKHLLGLINDILDLSKIEAGRMDVYMEQVFLSRLVDEVKTIVSPMVSKNANALVIECPTDIGSLRTDVTKLKQSLINLLSNAAKFTKQGTVTLHLARERAAGGGEDIRLSVSDNGIGMTEEQMGRLFQAFTQADASTTRNFGGTGLGLTITKHFVAMLGGRIEVSSEAGKGSTFTILLPQSEAGQPAHSEENGKAPNLLDKARQGAVTVLVVDDDPAVHEVLAATLGKEGYHLIHARDGYEALEVMRREPPDIVTLDVMMPKIDGWSVLGIMKSDPALDHIPVIMLTIVDDRTLGFSLGAAEYMTKPIDRRRLLALIHKFTPAQSETSILVVDDDADVRALVRSTIEDTGVTVAEAVNGREALEWLAANPRPSLVLLDLMMPVMDGMEFLERVRGMPKFAELPIVVLTAKELTVEERSFLARNTLLILNKSAQPIGTLGAALAAIAGRAPVPGSAPASRE